MTDVEGDPKVTGNAPAGRTQLISESSDPGRQLPNESIGGIIAEHSRFFAALECGANVESAIEQAYGWQLELVDPQMALSQIDQIVIRRLNDFVARSEQPAILDCGANIGISVLNYKRRYPGARIKAFEPDPAICRVLRDNLARNGAADVEVIEAAVWTRTGKIGFALTGRDGGRIDRSSGGASRLPRVAAVDLRDYLNEPLDLLKLDVEGAEYDLVHHVRRDLTNVANVVLECHINQATLARFSTLLNDLQTNRFRLSLNTFGRWTDLVRRSAVIPPYSEQYLALYGWRADAPPPLFGASHIPYVDFSLIAELSRVYDRRGAPQYYDHDQATGATASDMAAEIEVPGPFVRDTGFCWTAMLPDSLPEGDTPEAPNKSRLVLLEDGKPIGPPHSQHAMIRNYGCGRFSHWHRSLYFSTSDDSDPNYSGRNYTVALPRSVTPARRKPKRRPPRHQ